MELYSHGAHSTDAIMPLSQLQKGAVLPIARGNVTHGNCVMNYCICSKDQLKDGNIQYTQTILEMAVIPVRISSLAKEKDHLL